MRLVSSLMLPPARKRLIRQGPSGTRADPPGTPLTDHRAAGLTPSRTSRTQRPNPNRGTRTCRTASSHAFHSPPFTVSTTQNSHDEPATRSAPFNDGPPPAFRSIQQTGSLSGSACTHPTFGRTGSPTKRFGWSQGVATEQRLETMNNYADRQRKVAPILTA
jgi:hypothetical protein